MLATATADTPAPVFRLPRDLDGWAARFDVMALPVLERTAQELELWRANEDAVDAHLMAEVIADDPLMTLKVLAHAGALRRRREGSEAETLVAALVMTGVSPFFAAFGPQPTVEDRLGAQADAMAGFERVLRRSHRAARFAIGFAVHRMDHDAPVIHEAALLHDFAELLLWLEAPHLALEIARRQAADPQLRSSAVQREVLHIELPALQHDLMRRWKLPGLLVAITDDQAPVESPQMRNVRLAIRVARHSALGWHNAALPDDFRDVGQFLQLSEAAAERLLRDIDH